MSSASPFCFLGLFLFPTLLLEKDPALEGEEDCWLTDSASIDAAKSVTTTWLAWTGTTMGTR